jgi:hypothetical protein
MAEEDFVRGPPAGNLLISIPLHRWHGDPRRSWSVSLEQVIALVGASSSGGAAALCWLLKQVLDKSKLPEEIRPPFGAIENIAMASCWVDARGDAMILTG